VFKWLAKSTRISRRKNSSDYSTEVAQSAPQREQSAFHENAGYNWLRKTGLTMARAAPRTYPAELKAEFLRLVREREIISTVAHELGIHRLTAYAWARSRDIDLRGAQSQPVA
jgi:hypothetical protein